MSRQDAAAIALKIAALALICRVIFTIPQTVYGTVWTRRLYGNYLFWPAYGSRIGGSLVLGVVVALALLRFADRISARLYPNDEQIPAATSRDWQPCVFAIAVTVVGAVFVAFGIVWAYDLITNCLGIGEISTPGDSSLTGAFANAPRQWELLVQPALAILIGGYLMKGASALVGWLFPSSGEEVGEA